LVKTLLLGACLLLWGGRLHAQQREVIATAVPVTPAPPAAPAPLPTLPPTAPVPPPAPKTSPIQQVAYTADSPAPAPLRSPNELLSGVTTRGTPVVPPPATEPASAAAASLAVEVVGSQQLTLGQPMACEIVVQNNGARPVADVRVEAALPAGARLVKSEPPATVHEQKLTWELHDLEAGAQRRLKLEVQPGGAGELDLRPHVSFQPGSGLRTKVVRPPFAVELTASSEKVARGEKIRFTIRVANNSEATLKSIQLYDTLPAGLHHPSGPKIAASLGDLLPNDSRTITLETSAVETGTFQNKILAQADQGVETSASVEVVITEPSLALRVDGPRQGATQQELEFHLEVSNPGPQAAKNVRLIQALPPTFETVSASNGANLDAGQHALVWSLPDLGAGQRQTLTFRVKGSDAGDWPLYTALLTDNLPEARVASVVHLDAVSVLKLEVRGDTSLTAGTETTYTLHVFNQGSAACPGLQLMVLLPPELTPVDAQGPSSGKIEGQLVRFAALQLPARADTVYRVRVRGQKAGQGHVRVELTAPKERPVQKEMSIQVHEATTAVNAKFAPVQTLR
jgi:uncharacterized repeat protein (TIGR01451 family)